MGYMKPGSNMAEYSGMGGGYNNNTGMYYGNVPPKQPPSNVNISININANFPTQHNDN